MDLIEIKALIANNEMDAAINMLLKKLINSRDLDEAILHCARWHELKRSIRLNLLKDDQIATQSNILRKSILDFLNELPNRHVKVSNSEESRSEFSSQIHLTGALLYKQTFQSTKRNGLTKRKIANIIKKIGEILLDAAEEIRSDRFPNRHIGMLKSYLNNLPKIIKNTFENNDEREIMIGLMFELSSTFTSEVNYVSNMSRGLKSDERKIDILLDIEKAAGYYIATYEILKGKIKWYHLF